MGLDYDRRPVIGDDEEEDEEATYLQYLKMQLWGTKAPEVLELLHGEEVLKHQTTLEKVRVKHWFDDTPEKFALVDLKSDGKATARGTSFQSYESFLSLIHRRYTEAVEDIEERAHLSYTSAEGGAGWGLSGQPILFRFELPSMTAVELCEHMFTSGPPFRFMGVPVRISDDYFSVSAVDLHVSRPVRFEITSEWLRVYLDKGSCGNTALRLLTNLQHVIDALAEAELDGDPVPKLESQTG